jgi:hypothetical protein
VARGVGPEFKPQYLKKQKNKNNYPTQIRAGRVVQVVESLPGKHETLSPNPSISKTKKTKKKLF